MNEADIDSLITETRDRLNLNWGRDKARFDDEGALSLLRAFNFATLMGYQHGVAEAAMFLGRLREIRDDYLGARLLYFLSKTIFRRLESMHWVPAKEYFNECPTGGIRCRRSFAKKKPLIEDGAISPGQLIRELFEEYVTLQDHADDQS